AYTIRLLVGDQEIPYGTGERHFYQILDALALCHLTLRPETDSAPDGFLRLDDENGMGDLTILILPWEDRDLRAACLGVHRIFRAADFL
ncbi:MAG: hypothetical protein C4294_10525, partial [Nitrospiraceae bacterium]